ncbi:MAG TPA: DUF2817 domain-containing protein [Polyangiaceae bacterium LLY-WYZ-15_(1-7)]|nr:DUF2817 domain-containing protein [Polyangiaceae bacterium LLY-WYZ-15_(1-7)]
MNVAPGRRLRELESLYRIIDRLGDRARVRTLTTVEHGGHRFPIHAVLLGSEDRRDPTLAVVGGVHGLERIGTRVVLAYLHTLTELLGWDEVLQAALERSRLLFVPLLNPVGMLTRRRSNGAGVDLMRNAPPHPDGNPSFLVGGQQISPRLPWYMGAEAEPMQPEAKALCELVRRELFEARLAVALDVHSGFGMVDRLWFPYARTRRPFPNLAEVYALKGLLDVTLPNHVSRLEPQARNYTVQGDLWDHLHDLHREHAPGRLFLPLTLEMGSWLWVKKNPRQAFSALGGFNPIKPHRLRRTLRRHLPLMDFLHRATASPDGWAYPDRASRERLAAAAFELWYA